MSERVAVTGLGVVSPLGASVAGFWDGLLHADARPAPYARTDPALMPNTLAYAVPADRIPPTTRRAGRATRFGVIAAAAAIADAGLSGPGHGALMGLAFGSATGDHDLEEDARGAGPGGADETGLPYVFATAAVIAAELGLGGPNLTVSNACAAGCYAVDLGREAILAGEAAAMVVGGSDSVSRVAQGAFNRMAALDERTCRPFDEQRQGAVFGEGAAALVIEDAATAERRGRRPYAMIAAAGWTCDAFNATAPEASGAQIERAIRDALRRAGVEPAGVAGVVCHGTGTQLNDLVESEALVRVFGPHSVPVCGIKSKLGHSAGAAGAFGALAAALALHTGTLPPTGNLTRLDPRCAVRISTGPQPIAPGPILVNAYAFGGNNITLVLTPP